MKKILNNKIYDDSHAEQIAEWDNGYYQNDFEYYSEKLYRTTNGRYFLLLSGGAKSSLAQHRGKTIYGGQDITELPTDDDVYKWLISHQLIERIQDLYPNKIEQA